MKRKSRIESLPFVSALIVLFFYIIIDGYSLFTLTWAKEIAVINSVNTLEFPIETYKRGTEVRYKSECKVKLLCKINDEIYDMVLSRKVIIGEKIDVRINPKTKDLVINKSNFYILLICLLLIFIFLVGGIIQILYNKKWFIK